MSDAPEYRAINRCFRLFIILSARQIALQVFINSLFLLLYFTFRIVCFPLWFHLRFLKFVFFYIFPPMLFLSVSSRVFYFILFLVFQNFVYFFCHLWPCYLTCVGFMQLIIFSCLLLIRSFFFQFFVSFFPRVFCSFSYFSFPSF